MNNTKLKPKELQAIMIVAGLAILFCAYKFIFVPFNEKTSVLKTEISTLEAKIDDLEDKRAHRVEYQAETEEFKEKSSVLVNKYPQNFTLERAIEYIITELDEYSVEVSNISIGSTSLFYSFTDAQGTAVEGAPQINATEVTVSYNTNYSGMKGLVDKLNFGDSRITIENLSASYSTTTGGVSGSASLRVYTAVGTGREYVEPDFNVNIGKDNVFGTFGESPAN